jgi:hypothetical protein
MKRDGIILWAWIVVFFLGPTVVDTVVGHQPGGASGWLFTILFFASLLAGIPALFFLGLALFIGFMRSGQPRTLSDLHHAFRFGAVGCGFFALAISITLFRDLGPPGLVYQGLVLAYVAMVVPAPNRRIAYREAIWVRSTPEAAFALVSNPGNWPKYASRIAAAESADSPVRLGSRIHSTVREGSLVVDADETVSVLEPGRRFGTTVLDGTPAEGVYDLTPSSEGTEVAYTYTGSLTLSHALLSAAVSRGALLQRMAERRREALVAIKRLLEQPTPANV